MPGQRLMKQTQTMFAPFQEGKKAYFDKKNQTIFANEVKQLILKINKINNSQKKSKNFNCKTLLSKISDNKKN